MHYIGDTGLSRGRGVEGDQDGNGEGEARSGQGTMRCVIGCSEL